MSKTRPNLQYLPIERLQRGKFQPRRQFDANTLNELAESIKSAGMIQPIVVRPIDIDQQQFEIVAGERRWRAAQLAGLDNVPCLVNYYSDEQTAAVTTIENVNRIDLNPIEEAQAYQRLINDFSYLHEEVAAVVGKSRTKVTNSLRLLKLSPQVQKLLIDGQLTEGHGKVLASLPEGSQFKLAQKTIKAGWSVRKVEQEVKRLQESPLPAFTKDPNIQHLERNLADHIGCKVAIDYEGNKGSLKIDFHNLEILQGLLKKMGYINDKKL